jgi:hypothetical protein
MKTFWPVGVVAQHRISERLPLHPGEPGGLGAGEAVERVGDRQQPHGGAAVRLASGQAAQLSGRPILADDECGHGEPPVLTLPCLHLLRPRSSQIFGASV